MPKVKCLVVDSNAFIKHVPVQDLGERIFTVREVLDEIRDRQTRARLECLPYELEIVHPSDESVAVVTKFSKATGDYASLSKTDILVLALTHHLHLQHSTTPLREEPLTNEQIITFDKDKKPSGTNGTIGFVQGSKNDESDDDNDDDGWIDSSNYKTDLTCDEAVSVGCYTTDFAMQNTSLSLGLEVISPEGQRVTTIRTWTLRCYSCFKIVNDLDKKFCPRCGNSTLKRVSVTVDEDGRKIIHLNPKVKITGRGKKFPLPPPKGGKHVVAPILTADQHISRDRPSKANRQVNDVFRDDFSVGPSPFLIKDVNSRSAMLHNSTKYWDRKNPNSSHK